MKSKVISGITALLILCVITTILSSPLKYEGKIVKHIEFTGLVNVDEGDLYEIMRTTVGYPLKSAEVRRDLKDIFDKGNFFKVDVQIEEYQGGVRLRFICKEREFINSVKFRGMDEVLETDITDSIPITSGGVLRKDLIEKSISIIKSKYEESGLFNAVVTYKVKPLDGEENAVDVIFTVDEGEEIKVNKIIIQGANKVYVEELKDIMETREEGFISDGTFNQLLYDQDKQKIVDYYKSKGYLDAEITADQIEYEWDDPRKKELRSIFIRIKMHEGEQYYFDGYSIEINSKRKETVYKPDYFMSRFSLKEKGEIFDNTKFQMDRQLISFSYASKGYIFARVVPKRTVTEREVEINGKKEKRKFVRIDFTVTEGEKAYVENIIIKGNKKTKDKVIRREILIREGELFDSRKIQHSRETIFNLGFFKEVNFDVRPGSMEGYMNLIVDVEEQPTGTISMGGGYGTASGFSIFGDVGERNLMGNGQYVGLKLEYGPLRSSATLTFSERWFLDHPVGFNASIFGYLYKIETSSLFPDTDQTAYYYKRSYGYSLGWSYRFWYYYTAGITWTHAFKDYLNCSGNSTDEAFELAKMGTQQKRTVTTSLFRNTKDNYLNPTRGSKFGVSVGYTGGYLGGEDHFIKVSPDWFLYYSPFNLPYLKSHPVVFELRMTGDFLLQPIGISRSDQDYEDNEWLEVEDRLIVGGPETLRGWNYFDSDLPDSWTDVRMFHRILYGIEMRVPIHPQMLWMAFFFDAGSLWSDEDWERQLSESNQDVVNEDLEENKLYRIQDFFSDKVNLLEYFRYSYGFGFKIQIPMMPLRFWFARKMIYDDGFKTISDYNFQFGIGDIRF